MNPQDWPTSTNPEPMLKYLRGKATERKLRLFAVACCRRVWNLHPLDKIRSGVVLAERHADEGIEEAFNQARKELEREKWNALCSASQHAALAGIGSLWVEAREAARRSAEEVAWAMGFSVQGTTDDNLLAKKAESRTQTDFLRDIFGNPFRPVALNPSWLTNNVETLAQASYEDRHLPSGLFDNQRMAVLADALEEAGCDDEEVLNHCRKGGNHVRGCWIVDSVLGKS